MSFIAAELGAMMAFLVVIAFELGSIKKHLKGEG
jgi:hypothetical protein